MSLLNKTKKQLTEELSEMQQQIAELEKLESECRLAEKALKDSEKKYRSFVLNLQGIAFKGYMDFTPIFFHGLVEKITGYTEEDFIIGKPKWDQLIHPDDIPGLAEGFENISLVPGFSTEREYRIIQKNGQIRWVHEKIKNVCDNSGKPLWVQGIIYDITERKAADKALEQEKLKLERVTLFANCGLLLLDSQTNIVYANKVFQECFGPLQQYEGQKCCEVLKLKDPDNECAALQTLKTREVVHKENFVRSINGEYKWLYVNTFPLKDNDDDIYQISVVLTDITDYKKAEEQIKKQNEFFNIVIESLTHPFYIIDVKDYKVIMANSASNFGELTDDLTCYLLTHKRNEPCSAEHPCPLEKIKETKKPVIMEHTHYDKEGKLKYYEVHGYPIFDSNGELIQIIEYNLDITERKKAEIDLKKSEEKYHGLINALQEGVWAIDKDDHTIFVNDRMAEMLGYSVEEMTGKKVFSYMDEQGIALCNYYIERRKQGVKEQHDFELIRKDGERIYVTMDASPTYDENGNYTGGVTGVINITERKKAEDALKRARDEIEQWNRELEERVKKRSEELVKSQKQLIQAEKLSAMGMMAGGLAHELNSPLAGLLPMVEKFRNEAKKDSKEYMELSLMSKACNHMARIIRDFSSFSRESKGVMTTESPNEIIEDILSFSAVRLRHKGIKIVREYADGLSDVRCVKTEIQQVILNIISKARDATPEGGTFIIRTGASKDGANVIMEFIDNGCGIAKEDLNKIFDPFFTTKGPGEGTGLGLSISHGIIKKHKGQIAVESKPGEGTKITISLPAFKSLESDNKI